MEGILGHERESLRPGIDKAFIVPGLEELGPAERRKLAEAEGKCWFCGTKGCDMCGGQRIKIGFERAAGGKRFGQGVTRLGNKRLKNEVYTGMNPLSSVVFSTPFLPHQQFGFEQSYNQLATPYDLGQGGPSVPFFSPFHHARDAAPTELQSNIDQGGSLGSLFEPVHDAAAILPTNIDPALLTWPSTQFYQGNGQPDEGNGPQEQVVIEEYNKGLAEVSGQDSSAVSIMSFNSASVASCFISMDTNSR
jgi:hypothetical protein